MSGIFSSLIFNASIFNTGQSDAQVVIKTGTGGIDPEEARKRRRRIYKPTGLVDRKKEVVEQRILESRDIQREVFEEVIKPQLDEPIEFKPIKDMTPAEVDREIIFLMREKLRAEEEDEMMLVMMIAAND